MIILHYALGFPPYRSGGLTKFCVDLMQQQKQEGHQVSLLWPGMILGHTLRIKTHRKVNGIGSYEIINPLPISYDEGIQDIDSFIVFGNEDVYSSFLKTLSPDVIHVHTLMGLHESFLAAAKKSGIRLVFTTHDFFPICPKVTMYRDGRICESAKTCENCEDCNSTALEYSKMVLLQSPAYRMLKETSIFKFMRKRHRDEYFNKDETRTNRVKTKDVDKYKALRIHYLKMLGKMDVIHYNSTVAKNVYESFLAGQKSVVIPITHAAIDDHRKEKTYNNAVLRIRYLGPQGGAKGFFLLQDALDLLWKESKDFQLDIHFKPVDSAPYMRSHARYSYGDLATIFDETDVLVCPSIWYETFGYTVLEALSFGVPVVISNTVGAQDIITDGAGVIIHDISPSKLCEEIKRLSPQRLKGMNDCILKSQIIPTISSMSKEILNKCYRGAGDGTA